MQHSLQYGNRKEKIALKKKKLYKLRQVCESCNTASNFTRYLKCMYFKFCVNLSKIADLYKDKQTKQASMHTQIYIHTYRLRNVKTSALVTFNVKSMALMIYSYS